MPRSPHPIPFRTRSLSSSGPMVLRLKARESRSLPGLPSGCNGSPLKPFNHETPTDAGWSSPVARQAHNLKVTGSNPVPAPSLPSLKSEWLCLWHASSDAAQKCRVRTASPLGPQGRTVGAGVSPLCAPPSFSLLACGYGLDAACTSISTSMPGLTSEAT